MYILKWKVKEERSGGVVLLDNLLCLLCKRILKRLRELPSNLWARRANFCFALGSILVPIALSFLLAGGALARETKGSGDTGFLGLPFLMFQKKV